MVLHVLIYEDTITYKKLLTSKYIGSRKIHKFIVILAVDRIMILRQQLFHALACGGIIDSGESTAHICVFKYLVRSDCRDYIRITCP